jgi:hypothetical protein
MSDESPNAMYWQPEKNPRSIQLGTSPMAEEPQEAHIDSDGDLVIGECTYLTAPQARRLARFIFRHFGDGRNPK